MSLTIFGAESGRRLVHDQDLGLQQQRARDGDHLLLSAAEQFDLAGGALTNDGEEVADLFHGEIDGATAQAALPFGNAKILRH